MIARTTEQKVVRVGSLRAAAGETSMGLVEVDLGGVAVSLPLVIINGDVPGPRVSVVAGIHGCEYVAIAALRQVTSTLKPTDITGSLVACLVSDPSAFEARSMYVSPLDGRNLNRSFPGDAAGTPTQRLAHWLFRNVIAPSERFIDMHGGDLDESLVSFSKYEETGHPEVDERARAMAEAYSLEFLMTGTLPGSSTSTAAAEGISAILAEVGSQGRWPPEDVDRHASGLLRALSAAGVSSRPGSPPASSTRRLRGRSVPVHAGVAGYFHPGVTPGSQVDVGEEIGSIQDAFGRVIEVVSSPVRGVMLSLVTSLATNRGDLLATFAEE